MKKISTLFKKDPSDLGRVINEVAPENEWALTEGKATRKFDGTACARINGRWYKRYDVKKGRSVPANAIPCQEPDPITGHWPHWVEFNPTDPADKHFLEALKTTTVFMDGTYELCGPKVQGNPENLEHHTLIPHNIECIALLDRNFEAIKLYLTYNNIEGIVFHHPDGRMCKIRKSDFGIKR